MDGGPVIFYGRLERDFVLDDWQRSLLSEEERTEKEEEEEFQGIALFGPCCCD